MERKSLKIIIATHEPCFNLVNGGTVCQYNLGKIIDELGYNVRMKTPNNYVAKTNIFEKFYDPSFGNFDDDNTVVIYCEGTPGNPLHSKKTVRWMLSELGKNVPSYLVTWDKNELVYYFNSKTKFSPDNRNIFKLLSCIYIDPIFKNLELSRNGWCHTFRKINYHTDGTVDFFHPRGSFEVTRSETEYLQIFNQYEYFVSYDPLTFLSIIAALCGCISIIYPIKGVSKQEFYKKLCAHQYLTEMGEDLYGVAYGNRSDEIEFARNTLHLVKGQWNGFENYQKKTVESFLRDIEDWDRQENTIDQCYYQNHSETAILDLQMDCPYYKLFNDDLKHMNNAQLIQHYQLHGCRENRMINRQSFHEKYREFGVGAYREYNKDLQHFQTEYDLIQHFWTHGRFEKRVINRLSID